MNGHLPSLDREALRKLRRLALSMYGKPRNALPMRELVELAEAARHGAGEQAGMTVNFELTQELAEPIIVVRVPEQRAGPPAILERLTHREREVADLVAQGLPRQCIVSAVLPPFCRQKIQRVWMSLTWRC